MNLVADDPAEVVRAIPDLLDQRCESGGALALKSSVEAIRALPTREVLRRLGTVTDSVVYWAIHLELFARGIPPCLRWPVRDDSRQWEYIAWLADLRWVVHSYPGHAPRFKRWRALFDVHPKERRWHQTALWAFKSGRKAGRHYQAIGLGLADAQRQALMTMPTNLMRAHRQILMRLPDLRERLFVEAAAHPDRSGRRSAADIADRRAELLRLFLLAGKSPTLAAEYHYLLSGERLSRQAFSRQIEQIAGTTGLRSLCSRS